jgi:hypothetical protein
MHIWTGVNLAAIVSGIVSASIFSIAMWFSRQLTGWLTFFNAKWSLKWYRAELKRFQILQTDAAILQRFLSQQTLWALALLGIALAFSTINSDAQGLRMLEAIRSIIGILIYTLCLHALSTVHHLMHHPERTIERLELHIRKLEGRLTQN